MIPTDMKNANLFTYTSRFGNIPILPIMTRGKTGTSMDKTGTRRDMQGQNRDSRFKTGTSGDKTGTFMGKVRKPIVFDYL